MALPNKNAYAQSVSRVRIWFGCLLLVFGIFGVRLFYLQVIRFSHYKNAALSEQLQQYEIPAERGIIAAYSGQQILPIVLNEKLYTVYGDPVYIKDKAKVALTLADVLGGDAGKYEKLLSTKDTRYVVLAKKVSEAKQKELLAKKYPGIGAIKQSYRTYPQGSMTAQVLGFVTDDGKGTYGIEQSLNGRLKGEPGELKAITDVRGVPLAASGENVQRPAQNGDEVVLGLDLAMQQELERLLAEGNTKAKGESASAVILEANTGKVKAMANVPTYDPSKYYEVEDGKLFQNAAVTDAIEVGSIIKSLTTAAALDQGVIKADTTYYDPASWKVDGFRITNIEEDGGAGTRSIKDILNMSLNTGVTWELMQMGGGQINQKARQAWYNYLTKHYFFGKITGIEQGYESEGFVPEPNDNGAGIDLTYANTTFGQAMTATPIQSAAALAATVNGGIYYQPHLVDKYVKADGTEQPVKPKVVKSDVVSPKVSKEMVELMQYVVDNHNFSPKFDQNQYVVGGKTGTAQIAKPDGGYLDNDFNGTYLGFVGGDKPQYVIVVYVKKPKIKGYAGTQAAQPIFGALAHMLIDNSYVMPKSN